MAADLEEGGEVIGWLGGSVLERRKGKSKFVELTFLRFKPSARKNMVDSSQTSTAAPMVSSEDVPSLGVVWEHQLALQEKVEALEKQVLSLKVEGGKKEWERAFEKVGVFWDVGE